MIKIDWWFLAGSKVDWWFLAGSKVDWWFLAGSKVDRWIGVPELLLATSVVGIIFALFSAQPLKIIGVTGPMLLFEESLYQVGDFERIITNIYQRHCASLLESWGVAMRCIWKNIINFLDVVVLCDLANTLILQCGFFERYVWVKVWYKLWGMS